MTPDPTAHNAEAAHATPAAAAYDAAPTVSFTAGSAAGDTSAVNASPPACANCGAPVPGNFCGRCGQRLEHEVHSVTHFAREVTEDLTHADSRLWSTLRALLLRPGFLTREFLDGRRVRYLPPLRLYLVLSVLFFLTMGLTHHETELVQVRTGSGAPSVTLVRPEAETSLTARPGETVQERETRLCNPNYDGPLPSLMTPLLKKMCRSYVEGRTAVFEEALWHNLPKALIEFLPLLALVMKALYWRPRRYYIEHLLFFLHNHAFAFLVFGALAVTKWLAPSSIVSLVGLAVWLYVPYYLYVSMRRVYVQGPWLTAGKFVVLSLVYVLGAMITLILTSMYSVWSA